MSVMELRCSTRTSLSVMLVLLEGMSKTRTDPAEVPAGRSETGLAFFSPPCLLQRLLSQLPPPPPKPSGAAAPVNSQESHWPLPTSFSPRD